MAEDDQLAGAVACLGQREPNDTLPLTDWLLENSGGLVSELPFLLEIPAERILGGESGKLYCIVPRDENTSLAVNHVTWESQGNGVWPVADEVLYREEYAQPVLVFVNYEEWPDEPDTEINLVTNNGLEEVVSADRCVRLPRRAHRRELRPHADGFWSLWRCHRH